MAARRITKSTIDWAKFADNVPANQKNYFQAFKVKSEAYLRNALDKPENAPVIDWAYYRSRVVPSSLVDQFEKQYSALKIPYPAENVSPQIDVQEKESVKLSEVFVVESNARIMQLKQKLAFWENLIPFDQMTLEEYRDAFPDVAMDPLNRPTHWPHDDAAIKLQNGEDQLKKEH